MAYFDTKKRSLVIVDGSPYGISAILAQKEHHSQQYKTFHMQAEHSAQLRQDTLKQTLKDLA
jgi:hypothetical protein